ncbi:hypothetical protein H6G76_30855 [Nostoc sp. FACHB-152]|uniref:hypothetical protein n=1 Tax=unclassified Nostoc TaxID=2593658 RepID=UPI0016864E65|nr:MULTISPECIES: hypothetical protein [unclassified Nostoc]MBD2451445.1 hypothetical protein [Nostoc sp. FACHB-152]MBD2472813.1 hypothetical protein [Nostoc sp. FACHB-145]
MKCEPYSLTTTYKYHPLLKQFLASIPPQTAATFTEWQLAEIIIAFQNRFTNFNAVDIRVSIPLQKQQFFQIVIFSKGKKSKKRLQYPIYRQVNKVLVTNYGLLIMTSLMGTLCIVEIVPEINKHLGQEKRREIAQYLDSNFKLNLS